MRIQDLTKVYQMLEDDESRDIYLNRLNYLISENDKYIEKIVRTYLPGLPLLSKKTIADLPAYLPKDRKIVLYGAGGLGAELLPYFAGDKRFLGFCSGTESKQRNGYLGYPVISPKKLLERKDLSVVISVCTEQRYEIREILKAGGYPESQVFGVEPFMIVPDQQQYFGPDFIKYEEEEVFVDAGCCDLSSSITLKKCCKGLKKVYAFEPDPDCYKRCLDKKERTNFTEAEIIPYATWSKKATLRFKAIGGGSSIILDDGEISISAVTIDETIRAADKITFIKMDVEGAELESLKGAKKTIMQDKPKLAICIYHKPEDMVTIPLYIKELVPEYKLYIRHHSNGPFETVLYAVM